ncbi:class I SAM-dependent methyltransferase [Oscillospiraceae bacterium LCP25S3_E3]
MDITDKRIDNGVAFDWGRVSQEYAKYRDIYPDEFYKTIAQRGLCIVGQRVLDLGTGTGVLPRNMYKYGADWVGTDISENQIKQAQLMAKADNMDISFCVSAAEDLSFPDNSFDVATACQCFWYFDYEKVMPNLSRMLKPGGKFVALCMEWLPFDDSIAMNSENLVLKYSPQWSGAREVMHPIEIPEIALEYFNVEYHCEFKTEVPFTRESWHGRMKACRGVGASLNSEQLSRWDKEHRELLENTTPESFTVTHYVAMAVLENKK